ncbi:MAG: hypothetical protein AAF203_08895 [Pseudomonadota bacterium]
MSWYRRPSKKAIEKLLMADKKMDAKDQILFVFLKGIGKSMVKSVPVADILSEAKRQNWVK